MADGLARLGRLLTAGMGFLVIGLTTCLIGVIQANSSPVATLVPGGWSLHGVLFIATGPDGALYRTEGDNADQIVRVEPDGRTVVVASGIRDLGGFAIDSHGDVFVSEDLEQDGTVPPLTGLVIEFKPDGTQIHIATMASPTGVAVDDKGVVYVVDGYTRVERVAPGGSPAIIAQDPHVDPSALAIGPSGDLYISDGDHGTVWRRDASGNLRQLVCPGLVPEATYLAVDKQGTVYVCQQAFAVLPWGVFGSQRALQVPVLVIDTRGTIHRLGVRGDAGIFETDDVAVNTHGDLYLNNGSSVWIAKAPIQLVAVETRNFWQYILILGALLIGLGLPLAGSGLLIKVIERR